MTGCEKYNQIMSDASTQAVCIREYRRDDAQCLHRIDRICFPSDIAFSRGELLFYLDHPESITRIAERNGEILGFALGRVQPGRLAHVLTLDVLPEARRQKVGMLLMQSLHDEFRSRKVALAVLEVSAKNLAAQRLYEALQYQVLEILRGYYSGREDANRMVRFF